MVLSSQLPAFYANAGELMGTALLNSQLEATLRRHRRFDDRQLFGKPCCPPDFDEGVDHRVSQLVRIQQRRAVAEHRDVELVDIAPDRDVQTAARRQRTD